MSNIGRYLQYAALTAIMAAILTTGGYSISSKPITDKEKEFVAASYDYLRHGRGDLLPKVSPLSKILTGIPLLTTNVSDITRGTNNVVLTARWVSLIFLVGLSLMVFVISKSIMGRYWALIPTALTGLSVVTLRFATSAGVETAGALLALAALWQFNGFLLEPRKSRAYYTGALLGGALSSGYTYSALVYIFTVSTAIFLFSEITSGWNQMDPAMRRLQIRLKVLRYLKGILITALIALIVFWVIYLYGTIGQTSADSANLNAGENGVAISWLKNNFLLRPLGNYLGLLTDEFPRDSKGINLNLIKSFIYNEPLPSVIIIWYALALGIGRCLRSFGESFGNKSAPLIEYLLTHSQEFLFIFSTMIFVIRSLGAGADADLLKLIVLPMIFILATASLKKWFAIYDESLARNLIVRIMIFANSLPALSLKSAALVIFLVWYAVVAVIAAPEFETVRNML